MLANLANAAEVGGFVLFVILTLIDRWPKMIVGGWSKERAALVALVIALLGWSASQILHVANEASAKRPTHAEVSQEAKASPSHESSILTEDWKRWNDQKMESVVGKEFKNAEVITDGKSFIRCRFENVTLVYNGTAPLQLVENIFTGRTIVQGTPQLDAYFVLLEGMGFIRPEVQRTHGRIYVNE